MMTVPVAISGMFRSGTTLLWRILASDPSFRHPFCEPLHPELPVLAGTLPHYRYYADSPRGLDLWSKEFHSQRIRLERNDSWPELEAYLAGLIGAGSLLKFCRMNLRLAWLLDRFPGLSLVALVRDPRAVCYSFLKGYGVAIDSPRIAWHNWYGEEYFHLYRQVDRWKDYLDSLAEEPPYIKILALWRVNVEQSREDLAAFASSYSLAQARSHWVDITYENLITSPLETLERIYGLWAGSVPQEVVDNALGRSVHHLGGQNKWQERTEDKWLYEWQAVPSRVWEAGIEQSAIGELMESFGYR